MTVQFDERARFSLDDKRIVLLKSHGKCAHCGTTLSLNNATMDHYIPYSKGGTNDLMNIVALCKDCNLEKNDNIVYASHYYKYLDAKSIKTLDQLHHEFSERTKWYSTKNFMKSDSCVVQYSSASKCFQSRRLKNSIAVGIPMHVVMTRAVYADLDVLYDKLCKYHDKFNLPKEGLKDALTESFNKGAVYKIEKGSDIVGMLAIGIDVVIKKGGIKCYQYCINGMPCFYQKPENVSMMERCIVYILHDLSELHPDRAVIYTANCPENDMFARQVMSRVGKSDGGGEVEDGWYTETHICIFESKEEEKKRLEEGDKNRSFFDRIKAEYSDFLQNTYRLKSLDAKPGKNNSKNIHKKGKRKKDFDEYDIEYYS